MTPVSLLMSNLDDRLNQAFDALSDRIRDELKNASGEIAAALAAERERLQPSAPSVPVDDGSAMTGRTLEGIKAISAAGSLSEVLDTLAATAAHEAARAAVLLVRGWQITPWRFVGFPDSFDVPASIEIPVADAGVIAEALHVGAPVSGDNAPLFAPLAAGAQCLAVPIAIGGEIVGVLYADEGFEPARDTAWPQSVEVLVSYAARCLEAITAFRSVQLTQSPPAQQDGVAPDDRSDGGEADAAAKRYARLLVSEIKLYHEPDVLAGRRTRDLATRLSAEIARARSLYEQRVPPQVGRRTDYFHAELVRTLADGDPALLELV